jgi:hypothetical protein
MSPMEDFSNQQRVIAMEIRHLEVVRLTLQEIIGTTNVAGVDSTIMLSLSYLQDAIKTLASAEKLMR